MMTFKEFLIEYADKPRSASEQARYKRKRESNPVGAARDDLNREKQEQEMTSTNTDRSDPNAMRKKRAAEWEKRAAAERYRIAQQERTQGQTNAAQ